MWIMNQSETEVYNSAFFDHFLIADKSDAKLIVASKGRETTPYTLGRYANMTEARKVLWDLSCALTDGSTAFSMPLSEKSNPEYAVYDKRTRRKGGS